MLVLPALTGAGVGLVVAFVLWFFLFAQWVVVAPPRYPTLGAATVVATDAGGRHRWPGTSVRVHDVNADRVDVERRWLGLRESVVVVEKSPAGWDVGSPAGGPAQAVQAVLVCVIPGAAVGYYVATRLRRRLAPEAVPT